VAKSAIRTIGAFVKDSIPVRAVAGCPEYLKIRATPFTGKVEMDFESSMGATAVAGTCRYLARVLLTFAARLIESGRIIWLSTLLSGPPWTNQTIDVETSDWIVGD
jgi:hypothetical protein